MGIINFADEVEFEVGTDAEKGKLIARRMVRLPSNTVSFESLGEDRLLGEVEVEPLLVRESSGLGRGTPRRNTGEMKDLGLGRILYERQGVSGMGGEGGPVTVLGERVWCEGGWTFDLL